MSDFFENYTGEIAAVLAFLIIVIGSVMLSKASCTAQTADMGFDSRWGVLSGCMIEVTPDQWIPLDSYYFKQE